MVSHPKEAVQDIADHLVQLGIRAFWNFAYTDLRLGPDIVVESVHLSDSLLRLSYGVKSKGVSND